jgi:hypothetical protein
MIIKSVQSFHPCKSVIQTSYDNVKAHGRELRVETLSAEAAAQAGMEGEGSEFSIQLPIA